MPVALLNEIVLAVVGMIIGYKIGTRKERLHTWFNKLRGIQDV